MNLMSRIQSCPRGTVLQEFERRRQSQPVVPVVVMERRLVKSPPEVWDDLRLVTRLGHWLGDVRLRTADPPHRLEWGAPGASGAISLESSEWGTTVRVQADPNPGPAWERLQSRYLLERSLRELLNDLSRSSLKRSGRATRG
jgi:hypothetical protein